MNWNQSSLCDLVLLIFLCSFCSIWALDILLHFHNYVLVWDLIYYHLQSRTKSSNLLKIKTIMLEKLLDMGQLSALVMSWLEFQLKAHHWVQLCYLISMDYNLRKMQGFRSKMVTILMKECENVFGIAYCFLLGQLRSFK